MLSLEYRKYRCKITAVHKGWIFTTKLWNGQGFAIDETRIMTNHHVVGYRDFGELKYLINGKMLKVKAIRTANETLGVNYDLAVIEFAEPHGVPVVDPANKAPELGDKLIFINQYGRFVVAKLHYVGDNASLLTAIAQSDHVDMTDRDSRIYHLIAEDEEWRAKGNVRPPVYYTGLQVDGGDSGGPVFNDAGEIVGVIYAESTITHQGMVIPLEGAKAMASAVLNA